MSERIKALFDGQWPALILFDLDGTLVDSAPDLALAVDAMLARLSRPAAGEGKVREWIGNGATVLVQRALADSADPARVARVDEQLLAEAQAIFREEYTRVNGAQTRLYAGLPALLQEWAARGAQLAVVTNKPKPFTDPLLASMGIAGHFALVVGGDCLPERKPHPMPLLHVASTLGVSPNQVLMVGDSRNDVLAARAADMPVICRREGYNHGEPIELSKPDGIFDCYTEFLRVSGA